MANLSLGSRLATVLLFILALGTLQPASAQRRHNDDYVRVPFNVSLFPGASIGDIVHNATGKKVVNVISWNIWAGRAARLEGVEVGGIWNSYTEDAQGMQFSGVVNTIQGDMTGAQFAGVINLIGDRFDGAQYAGIVNVVREDASVAQFAGIANLVGGDLRGAQFAGVANLAREEAEAIQVAGVANLAREDFIGLQVGGIANLAGDDLYGAQIAGVVNVAEEVHGLQLGVVNVAEEHYGVPVGLLSYVGDVGLRFDLWADETGFATTAIRSGNRRFANFLGLGARPFGSGDARWSATVGLGTEIPIGGGHFVGIDLLHQGILQRSSFRETPSSLSRLRAVAGFRIADYFALYAGPSFNVFLSSEDDGKDLAPWSIYDYANDDIFLRMWPGFTFGIRLYTRP